VGQTQPLNSEVAQPIALTAQASSNSAGAAQFTFNTTPAGGEVWSGTLQCPAAPAGTLFAVSVGGTPWGSFGGFSVGGPIQVPPGANVVVTAVGLAASTTYQLNFVGSSDDFSGTQPIWPEPNAASLAAIISGLVAAEGIVDLIVPNTFSNIPANTPVGVTGVALHPYSTLVFIISAGGLAEITAAAIRTTPTSAVWPAQTQPGGGQQAFGLSINTFLLPCSYAAGDTVDVQFSTTLALSTTFAVYGIGAQQTVQVIAPVGNPLSVANRGGAQSVTITAPASAAANILPAPPAGFVYRLHRLITPDAGPLIIAQGSTSSLGPNFISTIGNGPNNRPMDDCNGLIVPTNIGCLNGSAATTRVTCWYDLVPVQALQ
jgi:hypothetical protein